MWSHGRGGLSAATQVKVLSPEITIAQDQRFHFLEVSIELLAKGESMFDVSGSKSAAGKRTVDVGTWENPIAPKRSPQGAEEAKRRYGNRVVGLTHIRGVNKVMLVEDKTNPLEGVSRVTQRRDLENVIHGDGKYTD